MDGAKPFEGRVSVSLGCALPQKPGLGTCRPRRIPEGSGSPGPAARPGVGSRAAGGEEPAQESAEPRISLIFFHKSFPLVAFSSPTGSREIELIMFQILEKSGLTGVPSPFPRSGSEEIAWTRRNVPFS